MKHEPMTTKQRLAMKQIVLQVAEERYRQHELWGEQNLELGWQFGSQSAVDLLAELRKSFAFLRDKGLPETWSMVIQEEFHEVLAETDRAKLKTEAIQLAAVLVQFVEFLDRTA
mgnify:CR=1 FL=1